MNKTEMTLIRSIVNRDYPGQLGAVNMRWAVLDALREMEHTPEDVEVVGTYASAKELDGMHDDWEHPTGIIDNPKEIRTSEVTLSSEPEAQAEESQS